MLRMPMHPVAIELLRAVGPMAVSSANVSGRPAALTAAEARGQLDDKVAVYLDGGQAELGAASTIVDLTGPAPVIVREGPISREQIVEVIGGQVGPVESGESGSPQNREVRSDA